MAIRTYGLSGSGMDVDQLVKDMMKARRTQADGLFQKKTQLEWKKADYNTMYTTLRDFRNTVFNNKLQATNVPKKVTSSSEATVTATALSEAANVTHTITVAQLADGVKKASSDSVTTGTSKDTLASQFGISGNFNIKIKNGTSEATIAVDTSQSINEFVSKINKAGVNVTASYDATLDRFFMYSTNTGSSAGIDFTGSDAAGMTFLGANLKLDTNAANGKDAEFALDGVGTGVLGGVGNLKMSGNTFTISDVSYNLKALGTANVGVSADIDKTVENVKAFIETYNTALAKINGELSETRNAKFLPLTDEQKSEMKDAEVEQWDKLAKSGMLKNDQILRSAVTDMRMNWIQSVSGLTGKYTSATAIGISTLDYSEGGKLYVDETKLRKALSEDPQVVYKLLGTDGDTVSTDGIATRLYDSLKKAMDKVTSEAGITAGIDGDTKSNLAKAIRGYDTRIDAMAERLQDMEDRYYRQFDAMEAALQKMNNQSGWLAQQFGGQ